jgi:uncharacterized protein YegJ (DUF2314 family)
MDMIFAGRTQRAADRFSVIFDRTSRRLGSGSLRVNRPISHEAPDADAHASTKRSPTETASTEYTVKHFLPTIIAAALLVTAASQTKADHVIAREDLQPGAEPQVFNIDQQNSRMKNAVRQARRTVGVFIKALRHPAAGQGDFEVKKPFRQGDHVEHMWLADVSFKGNRFHGIVDNVPRKIKGLKMGDRVSVNPDEISDWAYVENGRLVGGYTIRLLYTALSSERRKALEDEARFRIENRH